MLSRVFPKRERTRGNVLITMVGVMGAASIAGIVSYYDYFRTIAVQKASMQYQTQINLALASSLDYIIWIVKQRACVSDNLTRKLCSGVLDESNTERLLFLPTTADILADAMGKTRSDVFLKGNKIERTVALSSISDQHPLYTILQPLKGKGVVDYLSVKVSRDDSVARKGREVYLRFSVGLRQKAGQSLGTSLESEALIAFFPRELANFSLITSGNLVLGNSALDIPEESKSKSDSSFIGAKKTEATGAGLVFQSPVFVNKNIYLGAKAPEGSTSGDFVNITFGDSVSLGEGVIYQKKSEGGGFDPFKPLNAGGDDSTYNYQNVGVFGGFLRGLKLEMKDSGLDCLFNDPAACTVDTSLMSKCISRSQLFADLNASKDAYLMARKKEAVQESGSGKDLKQIYVYDIGLTSPSEFVPVNGLSVERSPGSDATCGGAGGDKSPCWNTVSTGAFAGDPAVSTSSVKVSSLDSSTAVNQQKPLLNVKATFTFAKNTVTVSGDLGSASKLKFALAYASGAAGPTQAKADLQAQVVSQDQQLYNKNYQIVCMNPSVTPYPSPAPIPAPSPSSSVGPSPCQLPPYNCNASLTECEGKGGTAITAERDAILASRNQNQAYVTALDSVGAVDGKTIEFEIVSSFNPKKPGYVGLEFSAKGVGYLTSAPILEISAYDVGVSKVNGKDTREPGVGPNQKNSKYKKMVYAMDTSGSNAKLKEAPPDGSYTVAVWKLLNGASAAASTPSESEQDLADECNKNQAVATGGGDWDTDYGKSTMTSWHFAPKHAVLPRTIPDSKNILVINSDNQDFFHVGSILDKCVIDASVTTVMAFLTCDELYIDYSYSQNADGSVSVSTGSYQQRTKLLEIIGTLIVGKLKIAPDTLKKSAITWRSIYHPASLTTLRAKGALWGTIKPPITPERPEGPAVCAVSPNLPVWMPQPSLGRANELYRCSPAYLRDKVNPIQWTSVTPDCGLLPGASATTCNAPFRSKNFMTLDLFRRVGGSVMFDQIKTMTQDATAIAKEKREQGSGGGP